MITEKREFPDEPACPPSIETFSLADPASPLDEIVYVNTDATPTLDGGVAPNQVLFEVNVRDCNIRQDLLARAWLDFRPEFGTTTFPFFERRVPAVGSETRLFSFSIPYTTLVRGCHKVELLVSSGFDDAADRPSREPTLAGDLGVAVWWLAVTNDEMSPIDVSTCP